jgi:AraC-like DNA-binding protein
MDNVQAYSDLLVHQQELSELIARHAPAAGTHHTAIPALNFMRTANIAEPVYSVYSTSLCIVAQGAKTATLADESYRYDPNSYLVTSIQLPITGKVVQASHEQPFLGLHLSFGADDLLEIAKQESVSAHIKMNSERGIGIDSLTPPLLDAILRLVRLLDTPQDIPVLSPLAIREIVFRAMQGKLGVMMKQFAIIGSHSHTIASAIRLIHRDFDKPLRIERLAKEVNMSSSSLHKHFKRITAMSPLQYQKTIRLQEARRLLFSESLEAAEAAFRVGYESPTQFNREYARMFGIPPISDVLSIRRMNNNDSPV